MINVNFAAKKKEKKICNWNEKECNTHLAESYIHYSHLFQCSRAQTHKEKAKYFITKKKKKSFYAKLEVKPATNTTMK